MIASAKYNQTSNTPTHQFIIKTYKRAFGIEYNVMLSHDYVVNKEASDGQKFYFMSQLSADKHNDYPALRKICYKYTKL